MRGPARSRAFALGTRSQEGKGGAARSLQYIILVVSLGIILKSRRASPATFRGIIVILCSFVFGSVQFLSNASFLLLLLLLLPLPPLHSKLLPGLPLAIHIWHMRS